MNANINNNEQMYERQNVYNPNNQSSTHKEYQNHSVQVQQPYYRTYNRYYPSNVNNGGLRSNQQYQGRGDGQSHFNHYNAQINPQSYAQEHIYHHFHNNYNHNHYYQATNSNPYHAHNNYQQPPTP